MVSKAVSLLVALEEAVICEPIPVVLVLEWLVSMWINRDLFFSTKTVFEKAGESLYHPEDPTGTPFP